MNESADTIFAYLSSPALIEQLAALALSYGIDGLAALAILMFGWMAAGWAGRLTHGALERVPRLDPTIKPVVSSLVRYAVLVFVIIAVLARFGVETTSIIAVFGAAGLAIGLALQGTLSNIAAGFMLLILRPISVGEYVDAGSVAGTIEEIGLFTTRLKSAEGVYVSAPNSSLWGSTITNFSRNPTRRIDLVVGISYGDDLQGAVAEMLSLMGEFDTLLDDPAPQVFVASLSESSVDLKLRCWTNTADYWQTLSDLTQGAKLRLDDKGYTIPFPQRDVHVVAETTALRT